MPERIPMVIYRERHENVVFGLPQFCQPQRAQRYTSARLCVLRASFVFFVVKKWQFVPVYSRVPTGGGKTLIAAHAVGTIAKRLGHQDRRSGVACAPGLHAHASDLTL